MKEYLNAFLKKYDFPKECNSTLSTALEVILDDNDGLCLFERAKTEYENDKECDFEALLLELETISNKLKVNVYTAHLLLFIILTPELKRYYKANDYTEELCDATILDLKYKMVECQLVKGVWGTFVPKWFIGFFRLEKFTLGRLQYRITYYPIDKEVDGVKLSDKTPFIDVHIPRSGAKLDYDEVQKSYKMAVELFTKRFNIKTPVFFCSSWALFPENLKILKPESNMARFIKDYTIVKVYEYEDYSETWRLFDREFTSDIEKLPNDTSLRRAYVDWIKQGKKTGGAIGVFVYKK